MPEPLRRIVDTLRQANCNPKPVGDGWTALCPSHQDSTPSLSVNPGEGGRVLVHCHAGCTYGEVMRSLGLSSRDGFASTRSDGTPRQRGSRRRPESEPGDAPPQADWKSMQDGFVEQVTDDKVDRLAAELGVDTAALRSLRVGYETREQIDDRLGKGYPVAKGDAFTFPMRDAAGRTVGINTRPVGGGTKYTIAGGRLGLFFPDDILEREGIVWIVEGASDTAAVLSAGYPAVGRPSAKAPRRVVRMIADLVKGREVVVVGENDRKENGKWPGREGAISLARDLGEAWKTDPPRLAMPPVGCKDARDWLRQMRRKTSDGQNDTRATAGDPQRDTRIDR